MNAETGIREQQAEARAAGQSLLNVGLDALDGFVAERQGLEAALTNLTEIGDETTARLAAKLRAQLDALEPSITMIGQVKAGKTSLVNAMVGWPGLLPADVNPWTSVVTSLHLSPTPIEESDIRASFRFFDPSEWDRLLEKGGRIGELAERAGHEAELEKVRRQVERMREKSRSRLGKRFELLLGQQHDYERFDEALIERYVCLGDDYADESGAAEMQGRFADITKSADLHLHRPEVPMKLCIRDTPGVNDTFMMREQITIRAIRDSRICVVVLSAHQALSTVDMALIRLISNIRAREVVIFVNRIDELSDPTNQVPEIRDSIRETLRRHDGPADAEIIFGSAHWACLAIAERLDDLEADSAAALLNWAESELEAGPQDDEFAADVWRLSGIPALYAALAARIAEGIGKETLARAARSAMNLAQGVAAQSETTGPGAGAPARLRMERGDILRRMDAIAAEGLAAFDAAFETEVANYHVRLDRSHRSFLERATASLIEHLEAQGESAVWQYEPTGLRLLLRSAYQVFGAKAQGAAKRVYADTASRLTALYGEAFEGFGDNFAIAAPPTAHIPAPVVIGQTIALDIQGNWWRNWWRRRRGYAAYATEFYSMIEAETDPIVSDLKTTQAGAVRAEMRRILESFVDEQREAILGFAEHREAAARGDVLVLSAHDQRRCTVKDTLDALKSYAA
jgi:translation elongation factor EF-Tu-like GTPase